MKLKLWGTRGSIPAAGPGTVKYGGDTSSVEVRSAGGDMIILDAGSGLRPIETPEGTERIDILLSHLHMDHVQGLPFYTPLLDPEFDVHVWGPVSTTRGLRERISRYLSPPLFPIRIRDLGRVTFHDVVPGTFQVGSVQVTADLVSHPGPTLGYRLTENGSSLAYLPDHEPALGSQTFPPPPNWTSGFALAHQVDVLIHDAQYRDSEYETRVGWGHSSFDHVATFAKMTQARRVVTFHHDPGHSDGVLDDLHAELEGKTGDATLVPGVAGLTLEI